MPVFEPFEEALPLQSGFYSFVIDASGRFRVAWGNTRSHASMISGQPVAAAGRLRVNRMGKTVLVVVNSTDYFFHYTPRLISYIIDSFTAHTAFSLSPNALFQLHAGPTDKTYFSAAKTPIDDPRSLLDLHEVEGLSDVVDPFSSEQIARFAAYRPTPPTRLYTMRQDLIGANIDGPSKEESDDAFEFGAPADRLTPASTGFRAGLNNFVVDREGWLIIGGSGHQILSGGQDVAAAGHIHFSPTGATIKLDLNFSGHYRPPLTGDYLRDAFRTISGHPLISIDPSCLYFGRWFDEDDLKTLAIEFTLADLTRDDPKFDRDLESLGW